MLDYSYIPGELSCQHLRPRDRIIVDQLVAVAKENGFYVCLANITTTLISSEDEGDMEEEDDFSIDGSYVVEADGTQAFEYACPELFKENIVQEHYLLQVTSAQEEHLQSDGRLEQTYTHSVRDT